MNSRIVNHKNFSDLKNFARENRKNSTEAEKMMWGLLRNKNLGVSFKRQYVISDYIVDFVCLNKHIVIEIDGGYHQELDQSEYDEGRTSELNKLGYSVLRFSNEDVLYNTESVIENIKYNLAHVSPLF